jgi:ABC-type glycerol-3-phosphate transport system permease component
MSAVATGTAGTTAARNAQLEREGMTLARRKKIGGWALAIFLLIVMLLVNSPLILTAINSLRPTSDILGGSTLFPNHVSFDNYRTVMNETDWWTWFRNSVVIATITTAVTLIAAGCSGYSLSRYKTAINAGYSSALMVFQLFPIVLSVIALFVTFRKLGLINTPVPAVILYIVMSLPFCTWMFKGFFDSIPRELEEAARIDGASSFRAMVSVVLPLAGPGAAAVAIFAFLQSYNEFMVASAFLVNQDVQTIPIGLRNFISYDRTAWGEMLAASTMAALPPIVLFLLVQKWMIRGMAAGAVKG